MNRKRILSLLLAVVLMFGTFPAALAVDQEPSPEGDSVTQETPGVESNTQDNENGEGSNKGQASGTEEDSKTGDSAETDQSSQTRDSVGTDGNTEPGTRPHLSEPSEFEEGDELVRLTWDNISWELTSDAFEYTVNTSSEELIAAIDDPIKAGNHIDICLSQDSPDEEAEAEYTITLPEPLSSEEDLVAHYYRLRRGDSTGNTVEYFDDEPVRNGSFTVNMKEFDSPWAYCLQFGVLDGGGEFIPKTYQYDFSFSLRRFEYMTWDNVSYVLTSAELESEGTWPEVPELLLDGNQQGSGNVETLFVQRTVPDIPASATFSITRPDWLANKEKLKAMVWADISDEEGTVTDLINDSVSFEVPENNPAKPAIKAVEFGVESENGEFIPCSYRYTFVFQVIRREELSWDNIEWSVENGKEIDSALQPDKEHPLDAENWLTVYAEPVNDADEMRVNFKVNPPASMANGEDLYLQYYCIPGTASEPSEVPHCIPAGESIPIYMDDDQIYRFAIGSLAEESYETFYAKTYYYDFGIDLKMLADLTWDNISWELDESQKGEFSFRDPGKNDPLAAWANNDAVNYLKIPVINFEEDEKVTFKITCPESLKEEENLVVLYCPFKKGTSDNRVYEEELDENGAFTFEVGALPMDKYTEQLYSVQFASKVFNDDGTSYYLEPKSKDYHFDIWIPIYTPLTWDNVEVTLPEGTQIADSGMKYDPAQTEALEVKETDTSFGWNSITIPVEGAKAGDKITCEISCPEAWKGQNVFIRHFTNLYGAQTGDTAITNEQKLENDVYSIKVEISKEIPSRWHGIELWVEDESGNRIAQTPVYTLDLVAKDVSGAVITAPAAVEGETANAVADNVAEVLEENPDASNVYIDVTTDETGEILTDVKETNLTLSKEDVAAVTDEKNTALKTIEIIAPTATVSVPVSALRQAADTEEATDLLLKVIKTAADQNVEYNNTTVDDAELITVTLYRVPEGGTEGTEVPINIAGDTIRIAVVTAKTGPLAVIYLPEDGSRPVLMTSQLYKDANDRVAFDTPHLSDFALVSWEEAQTLTKTSSRHRRPSSSGGSSSSSAETGEVNLDSGSSRNGTIECSPKNPKSGNRVTLTAVPAPGFVLDSIAVKDEDGDEVKLTKADENRYTFTMPSGDVTVSARFVSDGSEEERAPEPAAAEMGSTFLDVAPSDWFAASVAFVFQNGMMTGNSGYFTPNGELTRAMIAQALYNMEGTPVATTTRSFPDVSATDWYNDAVAWAVSQGCMSGYGNGNFGPNDLITREQLAAVFNGYSRIKGYDVAAADGALSFADSASVSSWAETSIRWAVGKGLLSGKSGNRLDPIGTATRAETAQILMNFYQNIAK